MILRNTPALAWSGIFKDVGIEQITTQLLSQFDTYLAGPNIEIVSVATADIARVFEAYFSEAPPFDGPGKKQNFLMRLFWMQLTK